MFPGEAGWYSSASSEGAVDAKQIRELIDLISRSNFAEFEFEGDGYKLKLVKEQGAAASSAGPHAATAETAKGVEASASAPPEAVAEAAAQSVADNGLVEFHSPIVGTFFRAAGPDAEPFVEIGSQVKKGQVLCIVEAMKVMNEIESEVEGEVAEVLVANGQPVEFGEILFRLRPLG